MSVRCRRRPRDDTAPQARGAAAVPGRPGRYEAWKATLEWPLTALLLVLAAPVILIIMVLIKLTSPGPALYRQLRVGRNGRLFAIYKIRTLVHDYESQTGPRWTASDDPRVSRLGNFLRRSHLDELPQLWNILRGEMSLVGPRPERPEFVSILERSLPRYRERLLVRPGLTGLAQTHLPPDTLVCEVKHKLAFDLYYVENVDLWLDLRLLACTALFLTGIPFRVSCALFQIPSRHMVEGTGVSLETGVDMALAQPKSV
jgi:lipopolysaccharide/colanic/teichoic acid biosynthesis glycosyltransferase